MSSGISIRMLETPLDMARAEELQSLVWPESETDVVPAHVMLAFARNGGLAMAVLRPAQPYLVSIRLCPSQGYFPISIMRGAPADAG